MNSTQSENVDDTKREQGERGFRLSQAVMAVLAVCMGLVIFSRTAGDSRFESYHWQDVTWLSIAGANFGIAFSLLINFIKWPVTRPTAKKDTKDTKDTATL